MDVAGALGLTAVFPGVIGFLLLIGSLIFAYETSPMDMGERVSFRRVFYPAAVSLSVAIIMWIVAIWMGYAQAAGHA